MLTFVLNVQKPGGYSVYVGSRSMLKGRWLVFTGVFRDPLVGLSIWL